MRAATLGTVGEAAAMGVFDVVPCPGRRPNARCGSHDAAGRQTSASAYGRIAPPTQPAFEPGKVEPADRVMRKPPANAAATSFTVTSFTVTPTPTVTAVRLEPTPRRAGIEPVNF